MAASSDDAPVAQMEDLLSCSICLETLHDARTLACFHSFCKVCLEKFVKQQRDKAVTVAGRVTETFNCPVCRTDFVLKPDETVEAMPTNFFITNMLEVLAIQRQAAELPCFSCGVQAAAVSRCITCERYLCKKCLAAHNNWPDFKKHTVLTIGELAKPENQAKVKGRPRCMKHENKALKFYCKTCKELVCRYCMDFNHVRPDHMCSTLEEVAKEKRQSLKSPAAILDNQLKEGSNALKEIEKATESLENNAKKAKDDIKQRKQELLKALTEALEQKETLLMNEVSKKFKDVYEPLVKQRADVKAYVDKVKNSLDLARNLVESGSNVEILTVEKMVEENIKVVTNDYPQEMKPIHDGKIQFKTKPLVKIDNNAGILHDLGEIVFDTIETHKEKQVVQELFNQSVILNGHYEYGKQLKEWLGDKIHWQLCYQASKDGWWAGHFHRCCDNVGPTVIVVQVRNYIFGGYTDQNWAGKGYKWSNTSFLFSLKNKSNLPPFIAAIHDNNYAILAHPSQGPRFGGGHDLYISPNPNTDGSSYSNLGNSYYPPAGYKYGSEQTNSLLAGSYNFITTEIEVFK